MCVRLGDAAVRRPPRVPEAVRCGGAVGACRDLEVLQVADGADVVEPALLAQRDPGRVVAAVLEALEPLEEERLALPRPDISDDSAHLKPPFSRLDPGTTAPGTQKARQTSRNAG